MNFRKMRYFIDVVRLKSMTKAAKENNITQCAMSQQIKAIEEELDTLLLIRGRNEIVPTKAGNIFLAFCQSCLERHQITTRKIGAIRNNNDA